MNMGQKKRLWRRVVCLMLVCACVPLVALAEATPYEGPGWETPEAAVEMYLEGLREQDIAKMISAYAVETYVDHFDLQALLTRIGAYTTGMSPRLPNANPLLRDINVEARKNEIMQSIVLQLSAICTPEWDFLTPTTFDRDHIDEETAAFVEALGDAYNAVDYGALKILYFVPPESISEHYASEKNQENLRANGAPYGADEVRSVIGVFTLGDMVCALCCDTMRYGEDWFLFRANGNIGALIGLTSASGGAVAVTEDVLYALLGEATLDDDAQAKLEALLDAVAAK